MCMNTSLIERTPGAGRHVYFSAGIDVASSVILSCTSSRSATNSARNPTGFAAAAFPAIGCTRANAGAAAATKSNRIRGARMDAVIVSYAHEFQFDRRTEPDSNDGEGVRRERDQASPDAVG